MDSKILEKLMSITDEENRLLMCGGKIQRESYTDDGEFVVDSRKLLEKGRLVSMRPHTRFAAFPPHRHNYIEMIYMYSGAVGHIINGESVRLERGDILLLGTGCVHEVLPAGSEDIAVNFIILPEFFETDLKKSEDSVSVEFITDFLLDKSSENYLHFKTADSLPVNNLAENLIWLSINSKKRSLMRLTMRLLIIQLAGTTDSLTAHGETDNYERKIFFSALKYTEKNYADGKLSELSRSIGENIYYTSRVIKRYTGKTFKELLQSRKLARAVYLLENTRLPISEIISSVGYENTSYFHKIFKEKYGCTPIKYRNTGGNQNEYTDKKY